MWEKIELVFGSSVYDYLVEFEFSKFDKCSCFLIIAVFMGDLVVCLASIHTMCVIHLVNPLFVEYEF